MKLFIAQQGQLSFTEGRPYFELTGWTVRAGYSLEEANMLSGATRRGLTKNDAIKLAKRAMGTQPRYEAIVNA